ncbi:MAG TPA: diacylglycerol kinase family protein [Pyrinomonadaceae bacterium]
MKSRLIVNPVSGTDEAPEQLRVINERLRAGVGEMDIVMTVAQGDAARAASEAVGAGYEQLFVAGGDGTLNEALNGVAGVPGALESVVFGLIPLGTGNDFARALGIPESVEEAVDVLLEGREVRVDVGALGERRFVNVSAGGFIAEVSDAVDPALKSLAGKLAYLIGGAQVLFDYEPPHARVRARGIGDDGAGAFEREMQVQMFAACNSRMVGGGRPIAPDALIDDGLLDLCIVEAMPTLEFIGLLTSIASGEHVEDERVIYLRAREVEIDFDRAVKVNTDGEVLETDRCRYRVEARAARFLAGDAPYTTQGESS